MTMMLNRKGGVAKTTNAVAIARCLAAGGKRTLLIDADHQCTASEVLLGAPTFCACDSARHTLHDLLARMLEPEFDPEVTHRYFSTVTIAKQNLHVLPCSARIEEFQTNRARAMGVFKTSEEFRRAWGKNAGGWKRLLGKHFDYVIVDCPPSLALQVSFFLKVCDSFILPCVPERLSMMGTVHLIGRLKDLGYTKITPLGLLWSKVKGLSDHRELQEDVRKRVPPYDVLPEPFKVVIPDSIEIQRSTDQIGPEVTFSGIYKGKTKHYVDLCKEILRRSSRAEAKTAAPVEVQTAES